MIRFVIVSFTVFALTSAANAATFLNDASRPAYGDVLDFGKNLYPDGTIIADQFSHLGVTFSNAAYFTSPGDDPGLSGGYIGLADTNNPSLELRFNVLALSFSFSWRTPGGTTSFDVDEIQESSRPFGKFGLKTVATNDELDGNYYGYLNAAVLGVRLDVSNPSSAVTLDNLKIGLTPIPPSATLLLAGLVGLGAISRKRRLTTAAGRSS